MCKVLFIRTDFRFRDNYGNLYRESFLSRSFMSLDSIYEHVYALLPVVSLPYRVDWSSFKLHMSFIKLFVYDEISDF